MPTPDISNRITAGIIVAWVAFTLTRFLVSDALSVNSAHFINVVLLNALMPTHGAMRYEKRGISLRSPPA